MRLARTRVLGRRALRAVLDARRGRYYRYPACCVAVFCWDVLLGRQPALHRALAPGMGPTVEAWAVGVPCGIFHGRPAEMDKWSSLAAALRRAWIAVRPGGVFWTDLQREADASLEGVAGLEKQWWTENSAAAGAGSPAGEDPRLDPELGWS